MTAFERQVLNALKEITNLLQELNSNSTSIRVNVAEIETDTEKIVDLLTPAVAQSATLALVPKDPAA